MYVDCWLYSKTCLKRPLKKEDQISLHAGQKYCRMIQGVHSAIILTFIKLPFVIKIFVFLSGCLRHVLLYWHLFCGVRMNIFIKVSLFTTKKDGSTGPTAFESDGSYFEIMGQWPGPTINLKACKMMYFCPRRFFYLGKQCRHWWNAALSSGSSLFANVPVYRYPE